MKAERRKQADRQRLEALTRSESDAFIKEIEDRWHRSAQRARLAIANTPTAHRREMVLLYFQEFADWLFTRVRQSLIERVEIGRRERAGKVDELSKWAEDKIKLDFAAALIPGLAGAEELQTGIEDFADYLPVVRDWLSIACAGWQIEVPRMVGWQAPDWALGENKQDDATATLVEGCVSMLMEQVVSARSYAREHFRNIRMSGASTQSPEVMKEINRKLAAKKRDFSEYLDTNLLTEIQRECLRLRLEHELTVPEIAIHLQKHRKTVHEHLARARVNVDRAQQREKSARQRAKVMPDEQV